MLSFLIYKIVPFIGLLRRLNEVTHCKAWEQSLVHTDAQCKLEAAIEVQVSELGSPSKSSSPTCLPNMERGRILNTTNIGRAGSALVQPLCFTNGEIEA